MNHSEANWDPKWEDFIHGLPKVELHVHLEGSLTPEYWVELLDRHFYNQGQTTPDQIRAKFCYRNFADFIDIFRQVVNLFKTPADFYGLTQRFLEASAKQNIRYTETMFTPWLFTQSGIDFHEMMAEIKKAAVEAEKEHGIKMRMIFDGPRNFGVTAVHEVVDLAAMDKTGLVIGIGLGGDEKNFPARWFAKEFDRARSLGLETIAHAGETDGERSMLDTVKLLKVSRMGHCLGIQDHSKLEELILKKKITLDLCPSSNLATGSLADLDHHPLGEYLKRNYPITLNSDDPGLFQVDLNQEFLMASKRWDLSPSQMASFCLTAVNGSFLSSPEKGKLSSSIKEYLHDWTYVSTV